MSVPDGKSNPLGPNRNDPVERHSPGKRSGDVALRRHAETTDGRLLLGLILAEGPATGQAGAIATLIHQSSDLRPDFPGI